MSLSLTTILQFLHDYGPLLLPFGVWLAGVVVRHIPSKRFGQLQTLAMHTVKSVEQQSNGAYTNEQKYEAASKGLTLLAARFGYRVNDAEAKLLIEGAVAEFKTLAPSTSVVPSSVAGFPVQVVPTQTADVSAGAV